MASAPHAALESLVRVDPLTQVHVGVQPSIVAAT